MAHQASSSAIIGFDVMNLALLDIEINFGPEHADTADASSSPPFVQTPTLMAAFG